MKKIIHLLALVCVLFTKCNNPTSNLQDSTRSSLKDPLPSWNDGPLKQAIIDYVKSTTDSVSNHFVPAEDRIATFDNDGTLWAEKPTIQEVFAIERLKKLVEANPGLAKKQPFMAVLTGDKAYLAKAGEKALFEIVAATHTGMSEQSFDSTVKNFFDNYKYPKYNVSVKGVRYQPQLELMDYLRAHGFKIFMCTGGTIEFVRAISEKYYGIPREQVIGTTFSYSFSDTSRQLTRKTPIALINDRAGKPVGIEVHIGKHPVFAAGNVGNEGDIQMLEFCLASKYSSFQLMVNHDDSTREFSYGEKTNASLNASEKNKWHVVSMKNDWKEIFAK
jgi:phosphoserine phosphatase